MSTGTQLRELAAKATPAEGAAELERRLIELKGDLSLWDRQRFNAVHSIAYDAITALRASEADLAALRDGRDELERQLAAAVALYANQNP